MNGSITWMTLRESCCEKKPVSKCYVQFIYSCSDKILEMENAGMVDRGCRVYIWKDVEGDDNIKAGHEVFMW